MFVPVGVLAVVSFAPLVAAAVLVQVVGSMVGSTAPIWILAIPTIPLLLLDVVLAVLVWIAFAKSEVVLTADKLSFQTGFILRRSAEIPLRNIESIYLLEPILGRLLGYGSVYVIGTAGTPFALTYLANPKLLHAELQKRQTGAELPIGRTKSSILAPSIEDGDFRYMPKA